MIHAVRICREVHAATAFSGEGAKRYGGRWNSPGRPMIYLDASAALAILEIAVHTDADGLTLPFVVIDVTIPNKGVGLIDVTGLPADWADDADTTLTRKLGDAWLADERSLAIRVPSAVVPREFNYLINPMHHAMGTLKIGRPQSIRLDPRIKA